MFLYLSLLVTTLCICESLTSIEIFDVFDDSLDLERPVVDTFMRKPGDTVTERGDTVTERGDSVAERGDTVTGHGDTVTKRADTVTERGDTVTKRGDTVTERGDTVTKRGDTVTERGDTVTKRGDTVTERGDTVTKRGDTVTERGDTVTKRGDTVTERGDTVTKRGEIVTKRGESETRVYNTISPEKSNYTEKHISPEKSNYTDRHSSPEKSNYTDKHINSNVTKNIYTAATVNNTNVILNNETAHTNGDHQNQLNSTIFGALNGISRVNASIMDKEPLMNLTLPALNITSAPFSCPEEEQPTNIGPYEVPTQRDVMLHIRNHLLAMYHGFHAKAMHFLKDVKEATRASWSRKMFCRGPTELMHYRRCVRWVGDLSVVTTKSLVTALETARHHINTLIQEKVCNMTALSVDPIHLIRILAAEKVSLEFALPDFLRQLNDCARHCPSTHPQDYLKTSHLTDKDFVIRHYLTQQNFNQQLKQQYKI